MSNNNLPNITQKGKVYFDIRDKKIFLDVENGEALNTNNRIEFKEVDQSLIANSTNAIAGGAVYTELANKFNTNNISDDISTDASSTTKVPSVKAIKDYADSLNNNANLSLTTSGSGNVITDLSLNNNVITITKGTAATTDNNTWQANDLTHDGYVSAPTSNNANKVWKTDSYGNPAWRDEQIIPTATSSVLGGIKLGYTQNNKKYPIELDGNSKAYVNIPWENTWQANDSTHDGYVSAATKGPNKVWKTDSYGVPKWLDDANTHYTTYLYSTGSTANTQNIAVSSGDVYLRLYDDTSASSVLQLHAGSNMSITSDANGVITFTSTGGGGGLSSITLNGTSTSSPSFYAPTSTGTSNYVLTWPTSGNIPIWSDLSSIYVQSNNIIGSSSINSFLTSDDKIPSVKAMVTYIDSLITAGNGGSY